MENKQQFELFNQKFNNLLEEFNLNKDIYFTSTELPKLLTYWLKTQGEFHPHYYPILEYGLTHCLANMSTYESFKFLIPALEDMKSNVEFYETFDYDDFEIKNIVLKVGKEKTIYDDIFDSITFDLEGEKTNRKTKVEKLTFDTSRYEEERKVVFTIEDDRLYSLGFFDNSLERPFFSVSYTKNMGTNELQDVTETSNCECRFSFKDTVKINRLYTELIFILQQVQEKREI